MEPVRWNECEVISGGLSWFWVSHGGVGGGWRDEAVSAQANRASITALIGRWGEVPVMDRQPERRGGGGACLNRETYLETNESRPRCF